jgi:hypothetical protein
MHVAAMLRLSPDSWLVVTYVGYFVSVSTSNDKTNLWGFVEGPMRRSFPPLYSPEQDRGSVCSVFDAREYQDAAMLVIEASCLIGSVNAVHTHLQWYPIFLTSNVSGFPIWKVALGCYQVFKPLKVLLS